MGLRVFKPAELNNVCDRRDRKSRGRLVLSQLESGDAARGTKLRVWVAISANVLLGGLGSLDSKEP